MNMYVAIGLAVVIGFLVAYLSGYVFIPWLHKLKFGQTILDIGPAWHKKKQGTPTMGGMIFLLGITVALAVVLITDKLMGGDLLAQGANDPAGAKVKIFSGLLMSLAYCVVGFADDYIKVVKKRNLGLTILQKSIAQILIMAVYLGTLYSVGATYIFVPFVGNVETGFFFWVIGVAAMYCTVNAVNFTDGVDGLCASVTMTAAASLTVVAVLRNLAGVGLVSACLFGALAGYLIWNWNPARVMMGDFGSMLLGGLIIALAYSLDAPWIILLSGAIYVIEFLSDIIQISYFKITHGKRIFKMAPIHHHFEKCGWSEKKICKVFCLVNSLCGIAAILLCYFGRFK